MNYGVLCLFCYLLFIYFALIDECDVVDFNLLSTVANFNVNIVFVLAVIDEGDIAVLGN